ncbi:MAG: cbb3-type cytochrome c oxidase subunit 3 [Cyclobacteriaceae bacterium]|nr:cbb3-type cytochrome c oxidase subunit 3 [Cyclobacteriaceae bacterium]
MYKNVLQAIENVEIWPLISMIIFFIFFLGVLIYILTVDKVFIQKMKEMPMDDGTKPVADENLEN